MAKLSEVEKELADTQRKLSAVRGGESSWPGCPHYLYKHVLLVLLYVSSLLLDSSGSSTEDPLDAFMTVVRSEAAMDAVERRKLHLHVADLRKDAQRLRKLVELTRPAQMPSLLPRLDAVLRSGRHTGRHGISQKPKVLKYQHIFHVDYVEDNTGMCCVASLKLTVMAFLG